MGGLGALIVKGVAAFFLLITLLIGGHAHFASQWKKDMKEADFQLKCDGVDEARKVGNWIVKVAKAFKFEVKEVPKCPKHALALEAVFITFCVICLVVGIVMIIIGVWKGERRIRILDAGWSVISGIVIIIAGILMILAALAIDNFRRYGQTDEFWEKANDYKETVESVAESIPGVGTLVKIFSKAATKGFKLEIHPKVEREKDLYMNKIAAGGFAIFTGCFYFIVSCVIFFLSKN